MDLARSDDHVPRRIAVTHRQAFTHRCAEACRSAGSAGGGVIGMNHNCPRRSGSVWIPAFAGMTMLMGVSAHAVQPDEILADKGLEIRARDISAGLRCLVCQNQSIDESDAPVARDLRILIREQLTAKKSDGEVVDYIVARYGEYVLLKPRFESKTIALWLSPFLLLLAGLWFYLRAGKPDHENVSLTDTEKAELDKLLRK